MYIIIYIWICSLVLQRGLSIWCVCMYFISCIHNNIFLLKATYNFKCPKKYILILRYRFIQQYELLANTEHYIRWAMSKFMVATHSVDCFEKLTSQWLKNFGSSCLLFFNFELLLIYFSRSKMSASVTVEPDRCIVGNSQYVLEFFLI